MKSTLLVVEDDEAILHLIDVALTMNYYKVIKAKMAEKRNSASEQSIQILFYLISAYLTSMDYL